MKPYLLYLRYVLCHKWFVFAECCRMGIPWRGLIHDWSKFLPDEFLPYARFFYGPKGEPKGDAAFDFAWLLHQKRNAHHWQWWVLPEDSPESGYCLQALQPEFGPYYLWDKQRQKQIALFGLGLSTDRGTSDEAFEASREVDRALARGSLKVLPMPEWARKEMLCDWRGAGRAQGAPDTWAWYQVNREKMRLHPETREWIERQLQWQEVPAQERVSAA